jgi:glycosyltransferase involved in cell wall biosynthesis
MTNATPLLTVHLFISNKIHQYGLEELLLRLSNNGITVKQHNSDTQLVDIHFKHPRVYVSLGPEWIEFSSLVALPFHEKKLWLHFSSPEEVNPNHLFYCFLKYSDPMPENKTVPPNRFSSDTPLVSIFTASYRSKDKIQRPYQSLLKQTYSNWEWVIVDDSGDEDKTYHETLLPLSDPRVRRYRQDTHNGYIGATKRYAAGLCTGEILVEVDHDDELTPDCLEKIVRVFQQNPECGFAFGDCTEVYVDSKSAHWYGWDCGMGYSVYYRVWIHEMNRWQNVYKNTVINGETIQHLVGLPNHPRAWTRDCYHLVGGHREELLVADDYDILVRTFLSSKYVAIPDLLYIQYRNENGDNSTFLRNNQIQILVREINKYYNPRIQARLQELELQEPEYYARIWERQVEDPARKSAHIINENSVKVSILFPIPYSYSGKKHSQLFKMLQKGIETNFKEFEVVIVGNIPPEIEAFAAKAPMGAVRWWPMEEYDSLENCIKYAKLCASCTEKIVVQP